MHIVSLSIKIYYLHQVINVYFVNGKWLIDTIKWNWGQSLQNLQWQKKSHFNLLNYRFCQLMFRKRKDSTMFNLYTYSQSVIANCRHDMFMVCGISDLHCIFRSTNQQQTENCLIFSYECGYQQTYQAASSCPSLLGSAGIALPWEIWLACCNCQLLQKSIKSCFCS